MKIGIFGKGHVGTALAEGLERSGHTVWFATREPRSAVRDLAKWAEVAIFAVPWTAHKEIAGSVGPDLDGKTVVDVSNIVTPAMELALGFTTSGAEELQKLLPKAHVVKAFNTVFARNMRNGRVHGERLTVFVAGDDGSSKTTVELLARDIGFEAVDAGPLRSARYLEPMGMLNILLGYGLNMGTDIGLTLIKKSVADVKRKAA